MERKYKMDDWVNALRSVDPKLAGIFGSRADSYEAVERMGLPHYKRRTLGLANSF